MLRIPTLVGSLALQIKMKAKVDLTALARQAMRTNGFILDTPSPVQAELEQAARRPTLRPNDELRDLRSWLWSSIDEATSRDLDQLEYAEARPNGDIRVCIAIADVDEYAPAGSAVDAHAAANSTSVYTGIVTFPMLPEELSTDLTSLLNNRDRAALVVEMVLDGDGNLTHSDVYRALVRNYAKLAYSETGCWLDEKGPRPAALDKVEGLAEQIRLQWQAAERLRLLRRRNGSLKFQSNEVVPEVEDGRVTGLRAVQPNSARSLIENFMVAANSAIAAFLEENCSPAILRIVRTPASWPRITQIARDLGEMLPELPDAPALSAFLERRRVAAPEAFGELSLSIVKLLGPGEYVVKEPGVAQEGHFALAVRSYTHFTAPNRRYADVIMQRLVKAVLRQQVTPYETETLNDIATHCTQREDAARKVERQMRKTIAAVTMSERIGQEFDAVVTGVKPKGTFARLLNPPVDGRIVRRENGLQVGDHIRVRLVDAEPERGFIDFARI